MPERFIQVGSQVFGNFNSAGNSDTNTMRASHGISLFGGHSEIYISGFANQTVKCLKNSQQIETHPSFQTHTLSRDYQPLQLIYRAPPPISGGGSPTSQVLCKLRPPNVSDLYFPSPECSLFNVYKQRKHSSDPSDQQRSSSPSTLSSPPHSYPPTPSDSSYSTYHYTTSAPRSQNTISPA